MVTLFIITGFISMVPLIELRGALPYAIAVGLPVIPAYILCIVCNMVPVPFIFFFARKVLEWGKDIKIKIISKFCKFCIDKGEKAKDKLSAFYEIWTKKEAYTKYLGTGLRYNLNNINMLSDIHSDNLLFWNVDEYFYSVYSDNLDNEPIKVSIDDIINYYL